MAQQLIFQTNDTRAPTLIYDEAYPSSHRKYFMKTRDNCVYEERQYRGDGIFAGKNYFELLGELNRPPNSKITDNETFGRALFWGHTKVIRKNREGKIETREVIYPAIVADDERIWKNQKPALCTECVYPEMRGVITECECDFCESFAK